MNLDRVTITGADDSVYPPELVALSERYPFVEWGILVSRSNTGTPRYPTTSWIKALQLDVGGKQIALSLHMCGSVVRNLLLGLDEFPRTMRDGFARVQLNFHAEKTPCEAAKFARALREFGGSRQFIFQIDGVHGNKHLESLLGESDGDMVDAVPLFDTSSGAGILPSEWPKHRDFVCNACDDRDHNHGYAGGLGPDNLAEQIPLIAEAAGDARFWLDMETRVRSLSDRLFDLKKVERCLQIAEPFVRKVAA